MTATFSVTPGDELHGKVEQVDGGAYISDLVSSTPSAANVRAHAEIVREKADAYLEQTIGAQLSAMGAEVNSLLQPLPTIARPMLGPTPRRSHSASHNPQRAGSFEELGV